MPIELSCQECGKSFKVPPVRKNTAKYCSRECAYPHRNDGRRKPRVVLTCPVCGKKFEEHQCHADRRTYCSNECRFACEDYLGKQSERLAMEGNPQWSGGCVSRQDGYIDEKVKHHPFGHRNYVLQHRLVIERHLRENYPEIECLVEVNGEKYLSPEYVVHHRNLKRDDNRLENLIVMTEREHRKLHANLNNPNKSSHNEEDLNH